jgi:hypothetical protein
MHSTLSSDACLRSNGGGGGEEETEEELTANNTTPTTTTTTAIAATSLPSTQTQNDTPIQSVEQMQTNPVDTSAIKSEYLADDTNNTNNTQSLLKRKFLSTDSMNEVAVSSLQTHVNTSEQTMQQVDKEISSELLNTNNAEPAGAAHASSFDPQRYVDEDIDENAKQSLLKTTTEQLKKKICILKLKQLNDIRHECIDNLSEQFYLEKNLNYADMGKWKAELQQTVMANKGPNVDENTLKVSEFVQKRFTNNGDVLTLEKSLANKFKCSLPLIEHSSNILSGSSGVVAATTSSSSFAVTSTSNKQQQQTIAERAKHEAQILQRISQLRKEGLWSIKRLPKLVEPTRAKTHWDFVLDEMTWMSTDFQQERKWKKNCSKKLAIAIQKYFKEKELKADLAEREETKRLRKQANLVARDIMQFWRNVEKIIEYKQRTLMEEKRKHALDIHLNFIVDQTEKYSSWLMEGLNANAAQAEASVAAIAQGSVESEPTTSGNNKEKKKILMLFMVFSS